MSFDPGAYWALADREVVVYRCYDASGALLYVGCTLNLRRRILNHELRAWGTDIAYVEIEPPVGRHLGLVLERHQIRKLAPLHNMAANSRRGWDHQRGTGALTYFPAKDEFREPVAA